MRVADGLHRDERHGADCDEQGDDDAEAQEQFRLDAQSNGRHVAHVYSFELAL